MAMSLLGSLAKRLVDPTPRCVVCGKRLTVAQTRRFEVAGPVSVLVCPAHEVVVGYTVDGVKLLARKAARRWLPKVVT